MSGGAGNQVTIWSLFSLLGGTIISSIVAYILQRNSFAEARRQKDQDKLDERKTLGLNLFHKMIRISSTIATLNKHMDEAISRIPEDQREAGVWRFVQPIAAVPDRVTFSAEELTSLMLLDASLFNDMGSFADIHNNLLGVFALYLEKRTALTDALPAAMQGIVGRVESDQSHLEAIAPRAADLDFLVHAIAQRAAKDSAEAWTLLDRLAGCLNKAFGLKLKVEHK